MIEKDQPSAPAVQVDLDVERDDRLDGGSRESRLPSLLDRVWSGIGLFVGYGPKQASRSRPPRTQADPRPLEHAASPNALDGAERGFGVDL